MANINEERVVNLCRKYIEPYIDGLDCYSKSDLTLLTILFIFSLLFLFWVSAPFLSSMLLKIIKLLLGAEINYLSVLLFRKLRYKMNEYIWSLVRYLSHLFTHIRHIIFGKDRNDNSFNRLTNNILNVSSEELSEQEYKEQIREVLSNLQNRRVSDYTIEQAEQKQYDNLLQILEQAIEVESVILLRELMETNTYNSAMVNNLDTDEENLKIKSRYDSTISIANINMPNSAFDTTLEHTLDICYKRVKQRFDSTSWFILAYAFGSEYNLEQYIKDKLVKVVLDISIKQT